MFKKIFLIIFTSLMIPAMVFSAMSITDVVKDEKVGLSVTIDTDALSYQTEDIIDISVSVLNDTRKNFENVDVEIILPEQLSQVRGHRLLHTIEVPYDSKALVESKALAFYDENRDVDIDDEAEQGEKIEKENKNDGSDATKSKKFYSLAGLIIISVLLVGITVCMIVAVTQSKKVVRIVSIILSVSMTAGIVPSAFFTYKDRDTIVYAEKVIDVDGEDVKIVAKITHLNKKHSQHIDIDIGDAMYDTEEDVYYLFDELPQLKGTLFNSKYAKRVLCVVEDSNGKELLKKEFSPEKEFTIEDFGMIVGVNTVRFTVQHKDGFEYNKTFIINNLCEKNMETIAVDRGDNDSDGVLNFIEELYHTDPEKKDTDNDGLSDYHEMALVGTDPVVVDTDKNDVTDGDEDTDGDGFTNIEEINEYQTNPAFADSDMDGFTDKQEIDDTKTNPNKKDTDDDGKSDKWEMDKGYDPNVGNSSFPKNECISDMENVDISADGEAIISVIENDLNINSNTPGYVGVNPFRVEMEKETEAEIVIEFDSSALGKDEIPTLYKYDEVTQDYSEVEGAVVTDGKVQANISEPGVYVLLNHRFLEDVWSNDIYRPSETDKDGNIDIVFVLDRSASMDSNDPNDLRKKVTKNFISKLRDNKDRAAIVQFTSIGETVMNLTYDKKALCTVVDEMQNSDGGGCEGSDTTAGTNGSAGLRKALNELEGSVAKYKYIIFLTDGKDTHVDEDYGDEEGTTGITKEAREKGIIIHTVGLIGTGEVDVDLLKRVAKGSKGNYYVATLGEDAETSEELIDVYEDIESITIDRQTDTNDDGISDYYTRLICEGRISTSGNVRYLFGNATYEEVQKNADFDGDGLKNGEEIKVAENEKGVYLILKSLPYLKDSDEDGVNDPDENSIFMNPIRYNATAFNSDVEWLTTDSNFISNDYLDLYDSSFFVESSVFIGNAFFGSTFDQTTLYRKQLVEYFMDIDQFITRRNQLEMNHALYSSYVCESLDIIENAVREYAEEGDYDKCKEIAESLLEEINDGKDIYGVFDNVVVKNVKKAVDNFDKESVAYFDEMIAAYKKHISTIPAIIPDDTLADSYRVLLNDWSDELAKFEFQKLEKLKSIDMRNTNFKMYTDIVDGAGKFFTALTVGMSAWDNYSVYCDTLASLKTVDENVYILDCVMNASDNSYLYNAALQLKVAIQEEASDQKSYLASLAVLDTTQTVLSEAMHEVIGAAGVPGLIIELVRTVSNLAFGFDKKAESAAKTVALAETSRILSVNFMAHLNGGYASSFNDLWVSSISYSTDFCTCMVNLILVRKRAEENMIKWESKDDKKEKGQKNSDKCESLRIAYEARFLKYLCKSGKL